MSGDLTAQQPHIGGTLFRRVTARRDASRLPTRLGLLVVIVGMCCWLAACRVDSTVAIDVNRTGGGTVTIEVVADSDAAKLVGDPSKNLRLGDLTEAGWKVDVPAVDSKTGELRLKARRRFRSPEELAQVLADLGQGSQTPFMNDLKLKVHDRFGRTDYSFSAHLAIEGGLASLSDPALTETLGGLPVGRTPEELTAQGWDGSGLGTLRIKVLLPGGTESHNGTKVGEAIEWTVPIASDKAVDKDLQASSRSVQRQVQLSRYLGLSAVVAAIVVALVGLIRRR